MKKDLFGKVDEKNIYSYTLQSRSGVSAVITEYGGIVLALNVPAGDGAVDDVLLGYKTLEEYIADDCYLNCLVGRYGNRIGGGKFSLGDKEYSLFCNDGNNHLHGGKSGFNRKLWQATPVEIENGEALRLEYTSPDGEEGFPGNLHVVVVYSLTGDGAFGIEYEATTDQQTVVCLTWHGYFNLAGAGDIKEHILQLNSKSFTDVDENYIPLGTLDSVESSCLDFRAPIKLGEVLSTGDPLLLEDGFDHNFVLDKEYGEYAFAARLVEPGSGRKMEMYTTEPGVQFYSGNFLDGRQGKNGAMSKHGGLCLEAQHFPDSPNKPDFPSTILKPGQTYRQKTVYKFSVDAQY